MRTGSAQLPVIGETAVKRQSGSDPARLVEAYAFASRASSIALQAVVPAGLGYWLDQRWGTAPWLLIVGAGLGLAVMLMELVRLSQPKPPPDQK